MDLLKQLVASPAIVRVLGKGDSDDPLTEAEEIEHLIELRNTRHLLVAEWVHNENTSDRTSAQTLRELGSRRYSFYV